MATIKDIAEAAGVSVSTVSNVINNRKNVGEDTRERILTLCEEMKYQTGLRVRCGREEGNQSILFVFSDFDRDFYLKLMKGISECVNEKGYELLVCTNKSCERYMRSQMTGGAIILDEKIENAWIEAAASRRYPIVVLDRMLSNSFVKSIEVNNYDAMCELVEETIRRGYRKFGFVGGLEHTADHQERYGAFLDTLRKNYISFSQQNYFTGDYRERSGRRAARIILLSKEMPEIIVCANDNMAVGVIREFRENGIRVPEDVAVTGFDNAALSEILGLTTVSIPNYERGYLAAQSLIERMKGGGDSEPFKIAAKVKWRNSVLQARGE